MWCSVLIYCTVLYWVKLYYIVLHKLCGQLMWGPPVGGILKGPPTGWEWTQIRCLFVCLFSWEQSPIKAVYPWIPVCPCWKVSSCRPQFTSVIVSPCKALLELYHFISHCHCSMIYYPLLQFRNVELLHQHWYKSFSRGNSSSLSESVSRQTCCSSNIHSLSLQQPHVLVQWWLEWLQLSLTGSVNGVNGVHSESVGVGLYTILSSYWWRGVKSNTSLLNCYWWIFNSYYNEILHYLILISDQL